MLCWPVWIGIVCDDLESQRHFYRDVLGLKELKSGEDFAWFDFDGKLLELLAKSTLPQYDRRRVSFAFEVDDIPSGNIAIATSPVSKQPRSTFTTGEKCAVHGCGHGSRLSISMVCFMGS